jgi:hypothetical protein
MESKDTVVISLRITGHNCVFDFASDRFGQKCTELVANSHCSVFTGKGLFITDNHNVHTIVQILLV